MNKILKAWREFVNNEIIAEGGNASAKMKDPISGEVVEVEYKGKPAAAVAAAHFEEHCLGRLGPRPAVAA